MKEKFNNFLYQLNVPEPLHNHILEGANFIYEEVMATANALGAQPGVFMPTIHKAAPWIQNATKHNFKSTTPKFILGKVTQHHKRKFGTFLEALNVPKDIRYPIHEAFGSILEAIMGWLTSDPAQASAVGGDGYQPEMLGGGSRPMGDGVFNNGGSIANSGQDSDAINNTEQYVPSESGSHRDQQDETRNPQPGEEPYKFPTVKVVTNPGTNRLLKIADKKLPMDREQKIFTPWWSYNNFFNSPNFFN